MRASVAAGAAAGPSAAAWRLRAFLPLLILPKDEIELVGHLLERGLSADGWHGLRDLALGVLHVQLGIGIGAVPIAAASRAEHHVAAVDGAFVHLAQVHGAEMDAQRAFVAEGLETGVTLNAFLAGRTHQSALRA